jgi:hypothetical protein
MRMIIENFVDAGQLVASPYMVPPVEYLQDQSRERVARSTSLATQTIDLTLTQDRLISSCVVYRGNFTSEATWRVRVYDTPAMGSLLYDSGTEYLAAPKPLGDLDWGVDPLGASLFDGWGYTFAALWFPPVLGSFVRITWDDANNPDEYMEASRLFVGAYYEAEGMPVPGLSLEWRDSSRQTRTDGGTLRTEAGAQYRALTVSGALMPETDRVALVSLLKTAGMREDVYVSAFAGEGNARERDYQMQAKLVATDPTVMSVYGYSNQVLRFEEI